ncbi:MAG: HAD-IIB family hydrolase [Acidimicrobiaceae bacterium]|nr:HAD-IIB family hydrolase [Acidimicrobiaceae bacterium]
MKKLFVFDLDGTLAESKSSISSAMALLLSDLLGVMKVAVISGGNWTQFENQLLAPFSGEQGFENLFLLPTCGTQFFRYDGQWSKVYSENLSAEERKAIISSLQRALDESGIEVDHVWGDAIEDRGSQITLSVLGQDAPLHAKQGWDSDFAKRKKITAILEPLLPEFAINMGGTTSIDVTKPGIDKAYGIHKLEEQLNLTRTQMLFAGDAIFDGGNDFPVQQVGVDSIIVRDPNETARVIQAVIACVGDEHAQILSPGRVS